MKLQLTWYQVQDYLPENAEGVYVIYSHDLQNKRYVPIRLGQGIIRNRLIDHQKNREITIYPNLVTIWAPCHAMYRDGVEKYLSDVLNPLVGERFPDRPSITVNI